MDGHEIARPPRWADALLRTCLSAEEAETQSGDLLEAYRDSILPRRGRLSADLWFARQVAGYMWRARGMGRRNWMLAGLALSAVTIVVSVLVYPGVLAGSAAAKVAVGLLIYAYAAVFHTRPATPEAAVILSLGSKYGLSIGSLWVLGVLLTSSGVGLGVAILLCAFLVPLVAGAHAGIKLWRVGAGMLVGFWSSLVSGLIVFHGFMAYGYVLAFISGIPDAEFPRKTLGGGLFLMFLGGADAVIAATIGGLAGILLARTGRSPKEPRRVLW